MEFLPCVPQEESTHRNYPRGHGGVHVLGSKPGSPVLLLHVVGSVTVSESERFRNPDVQDQNSVCALSGVESLIGS